MTANRTARRFHTPGPLAVGLVVTLGADASYHAARVLRLKAGDNLRLFNGEGDEFCGCVQVVDSRAMQVQVMQRFAETPPAQVPVILAFAPPPGQRADFLIEKATEAGASRFQPVLTERVQPAQAKAAAARIERWQRKARDAARQSGRADIPEIAPPLPWPAFLAQTPPEGLRIIGADPTSPPLWNVLAALDSSPARVTIAVGPAGGFTPAELTCAVDAGYTAVSLGPHILRVETACVCMTGVVRQRLFGMMSDECTTTTTTETA